MATQGAERFVQDRALRLKTGAGVQTQVRRPSCRIRPQVPGKPNLERDSRYPVKVDFAHPVVTVTAQQRQSNICIRDTMACRLLVWVVDAQKACAGE